MHPSNAPTNLVINRSTFKEIHGNENTYHYHESGLTRLLQASAKDAAYDSIERHPPSKCHPGTRLDIIEIVERWITDTVEPGVFWLHGPAGAGKSAIAQTICESSAKRNQLLASFFFMRNSRDRGTIKNFIPTLALQLSTSRTDLRQHIGNAVDADLAVIHRSTSTQLLKLIIEPFRSTTPSQSAPFLVVVDGLDECEGKDHQLRILSHISELTTKYDLPIRFLITSRPEPHIKHFFDVSVTQKSSIVFSIYGHGSEYGDVYKLLRSKFNEISASERHASTLAHIDKPWPSDDIVQLLAHKSDGYFIYASTLLKYIDDEFSPCTKRLQEVIQASGPNSTAFGELDKLYTQILSTSPNVRLLSRALGCLIILPKYVLAQRFKEVERVLELWPGEGVTIFRGLHAVLNFKGAGRVTPFHASLSDFLFDETRSNKFYIDPQICHVDIVLYNLRSITDWPKSKDGNYHISGIVPLLNRLTFLGPGFNHISDKHEASLIEYMAHEWTPNFWMALLSKTRKWQPEEKGYIFSSLGRMVELFKDMSGRHSDLTKYNDDFLARVFRNLCPTPASPDEARCMQNAFTILRGASQLSYEEEFSFPAIRLILPVSEPIGAAAQKRVIDFHRYIITVSRTVDWALLDDLMGDPKKCGALYCDVGVRNARVVQRYMTKLATATLRLRVARNELPDSDRAPYVFDSDAGYTAVKKVWSYHLLASPPGNAQLVSLLRKITPRSDSNVFSDLHTVHASRIVEWLKKSQEPPLDLLARWQSIHELPDPQRNSFLPPLQKT